MSFENRQESDRFAIAIAKPLKGEALAAARVVFGNDLKPFSNRPVKARVFDEIDYGPGSADNRFILHIFLRPAEIWGLGEYGTYDHIVGMPGGVKGRRQQSSARLSSFGKLEQTRKRLRTNRKTTPVFLKAPGYAHPVRGPIFVKGIPGKGLIRYAFKRVREAQGTVVAAEWDRYVARAVERANNGA
jgi:hypothetical protein